MAFGGVPDFFENPCPAGPSPRRSSSRGVARRRVRTIGPQCEGSPARTRPRRRIRNGIEPRTYHEEFPMSIRPIAIAAVVLALCRASARAEITITIEQQGNDVVATGSGTINLTDLINPTQTTTFTGVILPSFGDTVVEGRPHLLSGPVTEFFGISGPSSFGRPTATNATTGFGDDFGMLRISADAILVPQGLHHPDHPFRPPTPIAVRPSAASD